MNAASSIAQMDHHNRGPHPTAEEVGGGLAFLAVEAGTFFRSRFHKLRGHKFVAEFAGGLEVDPSNPDTSLPKKITAASDEQLQKVFALTSQRIVDLEEQKFGRRIDHLMQSAQFNDLHVTRHEVREGLSLMRTIPGTEKANERLDTLAPDDESRLQRYHAGLNLLASAMEDRGLAPRGIPSPVDDAIVPDGYRDVADRSVGMHPRLAAMEHRERGEKLLALSVQGLRLSPNVYSDEEPAHFTLISRSPDHELVEAVRRTDLFADQYENKLESVQRKAWMEQAGVGPGKGSIEAFTAETEAFEKSTPKQRWEKTGAGLSDQELVGLVMLRKGRQVLLEHSKGRGLEIALINSANDLAVKPLNIAQAISNRDRDNYELGIVRTPDRDVSDVVQEAVKARAAAQILPHQLAAYASLRGNRI